MSIYWITARMDKELTHDVSGCVVLRLANIPEEDRALSEKAYVEKILGCDVLTMQSLPYAASPLLLGSDMTFCFQPRQCAGRSSCPRPRSCCD